MYVPKAVNPAKNRPGQVSSKTSHKINDVICHYCKFSHLKPIYMWESLLNAYDGWNITLGWQSITLHKKQSLAQCDSVINLKALANDLLKTSFRGGEREGRTNVCVCDCVCCEGAYVEAKANFDFADPRAARAEFQTRQSRKYN